MSEDDEIDRAELEDYILTAIAYAIQGASEDFPNAARRDFPPETDGKMTLSQYLRSNEVSDHLAEAILVSLTKHRLRVIFDEDSQPGQPVA
jgi:hypothetical protein